MTTEDDFSEEGARASSLIPVHKLATRDPLHDMQLLRDVAIINERVRRELGPVPTANTVPQSRDAQNREMNDMRTRTLAAAAVLAAAPVCQSAASGAQLDGLQHQYPIFARYIDEDKALLAFKVAPDEEGGATAALILRYPKEPAPNRGTFYGDRAGYFCELVLLYARSEDVRVTGRSRAVIDCENNQANLVAAPLELNEQLELTPKKVTFEDEYFLGGAHSTSFERSGETWHLSRVSSSRKSSTADSEGVIFVDGVASYPKDFGYISMDRFHRGEVEGSLSKNETISK
jgi:hypothetical protein